MKEKKVFIFIGPPGAGKGSLSQYCTAKLGWKQLSTGSLCRKNIDEQTEIGKQIDFAIKSGKLISDDLIVSMVEEWLINNSSHFQTAILDGFPRTVQQAEALNVLLTQKIKNCDLRIIRLFISDDTIIHRLSGRLICSNNNCQAIYSLLPLSDHAPERVMTCDTCQDKLMRRADDAMNAVIERLKIYHTHEQQLLNYYRDYGFAISEVNVEKPLKDVFDDFQNLLQIIK